MRLKGAKAAIAHMRHNQVIEPNSTLTTPAMAYHDSPMPCDLMELLYQTTGVMSTPEVV